MSHFRHWAIFAALEDVNINFENKFCVPPDLSVIYFLVEFNSTWGIRQGPDLFDCYRSELRGKEFKIKTWYLSWLLSGIIGNHLFLKAN